MKLIVVDLEMLQPGDEICEIGAVLLCLGTGEIERSFQTYCNPGVVVTDYRMKNKQTITELTGIDQTMLDAAPSRKQALTEFWRFVDNCNCGRRIGDWGGGDVKCLISQSKEEGVVPSKNIQAWNIAIISALFRSAVPKIKMNGGLFNSMTTFGLEFEGEQHRALADATNTATLLVELYSKIRKIIQIENMFK